jgi:hypothetical protein
MADETGSPYLTRYASDILPAITGEYAIAMNLDFKRDLFDEM